MTPQGHACPDCGPANNTPGARGAFYGARRPRMGLETRVDAQYASEMQPGARLSLSLTDH